MTNRTMKKHLEEAMLLKTRIKDLEAELEKHQNALKDGMLDSGIDCFESGGHKATYKAVTSNRFDSALFRRDHADLYDAYKRESTAMRFTLV